MLHAQGEFQLGEHTARFVKSKDIVAEVEFLAPAGLSLSQTGEYDTPPHDWYTIKPQEWHLTAETTTPAKQMEFISVIKIGTESITATLEEDKGQRRVRIQTPGMTTTVDLIHR